MTTLENVSVYLPPEIEGFLKKNYPYLNYRFISEDTVIDVEDRFLTKEGTTGRVLGKYRITVNAKGEVLIDPLTDKEEYLFPNENGDPDLTAALFGDNSTPTRS